MVAKMLIQLRRLGERNMPNVGVGMLIVFGIVTAVIAVSTSRELELGDASGIAALLIFATIFADFFVTWLRSRTKGGSAARCGLHAEA